MYILPKINGLNSVVDLKEGCSCMKRRRFIIVSVVVIVFVILVGGYIYNKNNKDIDGDFNNTSPKPLDKEIIKNIKLYYPKWMETLDVKDDMIIGYEGRYGHTYQLGDNNYIALNINDRKGDYIKELVQKDKNYTKKYPDDHYKMTKRTIYYSFTFKPGKQGYGYKNFLDSASEHLGLDLELDGTMKIGFALNDDELGMPILDNIQLLEIFQGKSNSTSFDKDVKKMYFSLFSKNKINGLKYIVLIDFVEGTDKKLEEEIKSNYPDVKIYQVNTKNKEQ